MSDVTRVHVPAYLKFLVFVTVVCILAIWYHYSGLGVSWNFAFGKHSLPSREAPSNRKVWIDRSTGIYYCPDSRLYGHTASGYYLSQGQALEKGYSPALHEPCQ